MQKEQITSSGTNFLSLLFLLFLGLKLGNVINWSWWWVFAPIWIPVVLFLIGIGVATIYLVITNPTRKQK